jgi:hypothetical protein
MGERKDGRVKRLAPELGGDAAQLRVPNRLPVERISEDRVPVLGEMNPNLKRFRAKARSILDP